MFVFVSALLSDLVKISACVVHTHEEHEARCRGAVLQWILQWYNVPKIPLTSGRISARVAARNLLLASHFNKSGEGDRNFQRMAALACFLGDCIPTRGKAGSTWKLQLRKLLIATSAGTYTHTHTHPPAQLSSSSTYLPELHLMFVWLIFRIGIIFSRSSPDEFSLCQRIVDSKLSRLDRVILGLFSTIVSNNILCNDTCQIYLTRWKILPIMCIMI